MKMKKKVGVGVVTAMALVAVLLPAVTFGADKGWIKVADKIEVALTASLATYVSGDKAGGVDGVSDAYFEVFEGSEANMEIAVRRYVSVKTARKLESAFTAIRKGMHKGMKKSVVRTMVTTLVADLKDAARILDDKGIGYGVGF